VFRRRTAESGLDPDTQYCYNVKARDANGNETAASGDSCATTDPLPAEGITIQISMEGGVDYTVPVEVTFWHMNSTWSHEGGQPSGTEMFYFTGTTTYNSGSNVAEFLCEGVDDGTYDVVMKNVEDTLEVIGGKGKFKRTARQTGVHEWGGILMLMGPEGDTIKKPFRREYRVEQPNLVISPTKMNVFYVGIPNPVSISVPGVPADNLRPTMSNGRIYKKSPGNYEVNPTTPGQIAEIRVRAEIDGNMQSFGSKQFRVKPLPTPVAQVAEKSGGDIRREILIAQSGVYAVMEDFLFDLNYTITQYTVSTTDRGGFLIDEQRKGYRIDGEIREWLQDNAIAGRKVTFEDLRAVGPDGAVKELNPITFTIR